jgi:hypothetical protein
MRPGEVMTEVGEGVAMLQGDFAHDPDTCPFCQAVPATPRENISSEVDDNDAPPARDPIAWVRFKNDAGTLASNLSLKPEYQTRSDDPHFPRQPLAVTVAAHHLIPGNAALKKSQIFQGKQLIWQDGKTNGNIGYDINRGQNGVWLPGNYAIRPWGPLGAAFIATHGPLSDRHYAFAAIVVAEAQFHDAHETYSQVVLDALDRLHAKLAAISSGSCPEAPKQDPATRSLPALIGRLDAISWNLRRMVTFPASGWKQEVHTSRYSLQWMQLRGLGG